MTKFIDFDRSLPAFVDLIIREWGEAALSNGLFLREASGRLSFVINDEKRSPSMRRALSEKAVLLLGNYTDQEGFAVTTPGELFDDSLRAPGIGWQMPVSTAQFDGVIRVVDRRIVGPDWLRTPVSLTANPPRLVFSSLKGGVGRSTALCVLASHLLAEGKRVLAVDMDLEAPGLGAMLLSEDTLPDYGLLDFMVESGVAPLPAEFFVDLVAPSWLAAGRGSLSVVPALGRNSMRHPVNVLAKLARAYLEQEITTQGSSFTERMQSLLDYYGKSGDYDVILIDARAGLHETTASAIFGIGAQVFLFGIDQKQTFNGYDLLFSHLATLPTGEWRQRLNFVQAKAPVDQQLREDFAYRINDLAELRFEPPVTEEHQLSSEALRKTFEIEWISDMDASTYLDLNSLLDDDDGFMSVVAISENENFRTFDPVERPDTLTATQYFSTFGAFLELAMTLLNVNSREPEANRS